MISLVDALLTALPAETVRLGTRAETVQHDGASWQVRSSTGDTVTADLLLLAAPAVVVSHWIRPLVPAAADLAEGIRYVSSAGVLAAYRDAQIARPMRGSGYVSTPGPGREPLLATSWLSSKWHGRAPAGSTILRGFFGGALDEATLTRSDDELVALAQDSWSRRFGVTGDPLLTRVVRWTNTSPQHEVGHGRRVATIDEALATLPPVAVCGSGFRAVGIPDVVSDARGAIRGLLERWRAR